MKNKAILNRTVKLPSTVITLKDNICKSIDKPTVMRQAKVMNKIQSVYIGGVYRVNNSWMVLELCELFKANE
jgi:hypothetical protein